MTLGVDLLVDEMCGMAGVGRAAVTPPDALDVCVRPEWERAARLVIDTQVDFVEDGAMPVSGTAAALPRSGRCWRWSAATAGRLSTLYGCTAAGRGSGPP